VALDRMLEVGTRPRKAQPMEAHAPEAVQRSA
jgi:hypothetical protein